jgi:hypothetical protein
MPRADYRQKVRHTKTKKAPVLAGTRFSKQPRAAAALQAIDVFRLEAFGALLNLEFYLRTLVK